MHLRDHDEVGVPQRFPAFELLAWVASVGTFLFLRACDLSVGWEAFAFTAPLLIWESGLRLLLTGLPLYILYRLATRRGLGPYLRMLFTPQWLLLTLRAWAACLAVFAAYAWLKVSIPLINYELWDEFLWNLDRTVHGGFSPNLVLLDWLGGTWVARGIDIWYAIWIHTTMAGSFFFLCLPGSRIRQRFVLSFVAMWVFGAWCYLAFPALGPVYAVPEVQNGVRGFFPLAEQLQRTLWENYQIMLTARTRETVAFVPWFGVAAMPSLHVGLHWLLTLWIRRVAPRLFIPFAVGTLLTLVGSVLTGWHYAVDGYAGILLAHACYGAARISVPGARN